MIKKLTSALLILTLLLSMLSATAISVSAEDNKDKFTVIAFSNFFPDKRFCFEDINKYADENGDIFISMEYMLCAPEKVLVNFDIDRFSWDNEVLELKSEYNSVEIDNDTVCNISPLLVEYGFAGSAMINWFGDDNSGKILGNFSGIKRLPHAYDNDDNGNITPVKLFKFVFKVLDTNAECATVNLNIDTISLDDQYNKDHSIEYRIVDFFKISEEYKDLYTVDTVIVPESDQILEIKRGDVSKDGTIDVLDASMIQKYASDKANFTLNQIATGDINYDGNTDVLDAAIIQKYAAGKLSDI